MNRVYFMAVFWLALTTAVSLQGQQAIIQEENQVIKTYPFSGPDPAPIMIRSSMWGKGPRLYPYFFFDKLSRTGINKTWPIVRMENPYIKVLITPKEGGKLMGAIEKSTGKEFIYYNHVRKFRQIALRGPWTSGGIELNFGIIGHTPATATPVDYLLRKNPDGSVSCIVGNMDLPSRTHWRVIYTVPPDKAYVETRALWYNPGPFNQSYYAWMNASNKLTKDLEFIYPGTAFIGHDYSVPERPWPITKDGRNLALFKNFTYGDPGSVFIFGVFADFAGGYWHQSQFGFGHWAPYSDLPGQKFFHWRLSRAGAIWEDLLTDSDGPYYEPQMGRLLDQSDTEFFAPYTADHWREVWFPYKKIGPMVKATPYGVLNARNTGHSITLGFCALQKINDDLVIRAGRKEVYRERLLLKPMQVYQKELPLSVKKGELHVEIGNKLSYSDDPNAGVLHRPLNFRNYDESTPWGLFQSAERENKGRNYQAALEKYLAYLKQQPLDPRALSRVAELYCRRAEYKKALRYASQALDYVMYDADANYIYGVIARQTGDFVDAKETLGWAARSMKYRAGAYCQIAEIYLTEGNLGEALTYLRRSLDYDAYNIKTYQVLSTTYRLLKQPEKAQATLKKILEIDPLNHLARFEQYLLAPTRQNLERFRSLIRNELPHETYLEIAMYYVDLGLEDDALRVLEVAPEQPTIRYWQAYLLRKKSPAESRELLRKAAALSPYLVFPFRVESIPMFEWAARTLPEIWKAKYYLGLIYWGLRRREDALAVLAGCGDQPDYAPFYTSRAFLEKESDPKKALADYRRAYALGKEDWRNWQRLAEFYMEQGMQAQAMSLAAEAARRFPDEDAIKVLLARTYLVNGRYAQCNSVLDKASILPYEGERDVHALFANCRICQALEDMKEGRYRQAVEQLESSKQYPERLGTGKPHNPDYRLQDYLLMICYEKMGLPDKAEQARQRIYTYVAGPARQEARVVERQVEQWYSGIPAGQSARETLRQLSGLVSGPDQAH